MNSPPSFYRDGDDDYYRDHDAKYNGSNVSPYLCHPHHSHDHARSHTIMMMLVMMMGVVVVVAMRVLMMMMMINPPLIGDHPKSHTMMMIIKNKKMPKFQAKFKTLVVL